MIVSFCGHADSVLTSNEEITLKNELVKIIKNNPDCTFYLGGYGNFDNVCFKILTQLKLHHPKIKRILVIPYLSNSDTLKDTFKNYDETIYPPIENTPPKYAILKRNRWIIENSNYLICYISHTFGGAYKTYKYAKNKNIEILNIYQK